jgi:hypothetical protein
LTKNPVKHTRTFNTFYVKSYIGGSSTKTSLYTVHLGEYMVFVVVQNWFLASTHTAYTVNIILRESGICLDQTFLGLGLGIL